MVILQALLKQVIEQAGEEVVAQIKAAMANPIKRTIETDIRDILALACSLHPTYLIIDAPDELDYPKRLLAHVQPLVDCKARILIMSREVFDMKKFSNIAIIEAKSEPEDIRKYLTAQFEEHDLFDPGNASNFDSLIGDIISKSGHL